MKKTDQGHTPRKIRPHRLRALLSSCIVAVFVVALAGFYCLNAPAGKQDAPSNDATSTAYEETMATDEQTDAAASETDDHTALDIELGYVHDEMIISFERGTSASDLNRQLASLDCVATKDVSAYDLDSGHITVDLVEGADVKDAVDAAQTAGFTAQPNFVYTLAAGDASGIVAAQQGASGVTPAAEGIGVQGLLASAPRITRAPVNVNDTSFGQQWALASVDAQNAWAIERCGVTDTGAARNDRVSIAVIDTGIVSHEDLDDNVVAKYNSYNGAFPLGGADTTDVTDKSFHGTHVAGIASAVTNNGKGIAGVSYNAGLVAIKVTDDHGQTAPTDSMVKAYDWLFSPSAVDNSKTNAEHYNVRVVNMSLCGNSSTYPAADEVLNKAIERAHTGQYNSAAPGAHPSILTITAAGNSSNNKGDKDGVGASQVPYIAYPSDCANTVSVINLWQQGSGSVAKSVSSNYNMDDGMKTKNISAPGTDIYSTWYGGPSEYKTSTGTSMAAPLVSGIAALVFSERPELSAQDVTDIIYASATDLGDEGWDRDTGYGEVNAYHALQLASARIDSDPTDKARSIEKGDTTTLTMSYADGTGWETYGSPADWEWKSSNDKVATVQVDQANKVVTVAGVDKGTATITATLKCADGETTNPNVTVSESVYVEAPQVQPASIEDVEIADIPDQTYKKSGVTPTPTVTHPEFGVLAPGTDFRFEYENNTNAGTARLRIVGIGSFAGTSAWKEFIINKRSIEDAQVTIPDGIYTGDYVWPEVTVTLDGDVLTKGYDYKTGYYFEPIELGTYEVEIDGASNYTGKIYAPFSIVEPPKPDDPKPDDPKPDNPSDPTKPDNSGSVEKQTMWRLYNPNSGEHFYTASVNEREALRKVGWAEEGEAWTAPKTSKTPVHRLYSGTDHHYTTNAAERDMLVKVGWKYEGIGWYSDDQKRVPLHRLYNPNVNPRAATNNSGSHHYTKHAVERDALAKLGWKYEDIGWYGM